MPRIFYDRLYGASGRSIPDQSECLCNVIKMRFRQSGELLKFCIVGGTGAIINLCVYYVLTRGAGFPLTVASPIAIELSLLSNFALNNSWTFSGRKNVNRLAVKFSRFHCVAGLAGAVNFLSLFGLVNMLQTYDILASLMSIGFGTLVNFYLNSLWTWKESSESACQEDSACRSRFLQGAREERRVQTH